MSETDGKEEVMRSFIEKFETMPLLWDSRNASYKNLKKRGEALETLLVIYRRVKHDANVEDVSKKINSLRSNYRKKMKKVIASKRSGSAPEDIYVPSSFLQGSELPVDYNERNEDSEDSQASGVNLPLSPPSGPNSISLPAIESPIPVESIPTARSSVSSLKSPIAPKPKKRPKGPVAKQNELLTLACNYLQSPDKEDTNDEFDNIAKVWACKLRNLQLSQRMFAEKAINYILFEAGLNTLHRHSIKVNEESTSSEVYTRNQPGYASTYASGSSNSQFSGPASSPYNVEPVQSEYPDVGSYLSNFTDLN